MRRRRNADEVARSLREADHDLAKGLAVSDICRRRGIAETTYPPIATADGWEGSIRKPGMQEREKWLWNTKR